MSKDKKKDRILLYSVILDEDTNIVWNKDEKSLEFRSFDGKLSEKNIVSIGTGYHREGKESKILRQSEYLKGVAHFEPIDLLSDRYLAIDTSYEVFGDNYLCATSCHSLEEDVPVDGRYFDGQRVSIRQWPRLIFLAKQHAKPERYGWKRYIETFVRGATYLSEKSFCAIVDSDLADIPRMNAREMPILDEFYLPKGIGLQYASADSGNENMQNKMIRQCDRVAKKSLTTARHQFKDLEFFSFDTCFHELTAYNDPIKINM